MIIYGINPVLEALKAGRVKSIRVLARAGDRLTDLVRAAEARDVPVRRVSAEEIDRETHGGRHQGVVADTVESGALDVQDLVAGASGAPLIVVLDGIEDPHNVGAILRTVDA